MGFLAVSFGATLFRTGVKLKGFTNLQKIFERKTHLRKGSDPNQ